ncbi:MAG: arsenate reductase ArsC, partial [Oscillospiraceae bacterium]
AIPPVDSVVTRGCTVTCPTLPCTHREDWGLDDPTGKGDDVFIDIIKKTHEKIILFLQK